MTVAMAVVCIERCGGIVLVRNVGCSGGVKAVMMAEVLLLSVRLVLVIGGCHGPDGLERQEHQQKDGQQVTHETSLAATCFKARLASRLARKGTAPASQCRPGAPALKSAERLASMCGNNAYSSAR